jgi:DNA ligase (NAD+)
LYRYYINSYRDKRMKNFLDKLSKAYYEGNPLVSDAQFDVLASHFGYTTVGHKITDGTPHYYRMYSLQKVFDLTDSPLELKDCVESPKLDGAAVSLLYISGGLQLALTRGDGKIGRDITDKMATLVPNRIIDTRVIQIVGEVVAPKTIENARNYASGSLGLKDLEEFKTRDLTFVGYDMEYKGAQDPWVGKMSFLWENDFTTVLDEEEIAEFPTDGVVYRINDTQKFQDLGYTAHHPRGAFALKEQKTGVETTLKDVVWQVGKSGVVSPVAILDPILIGDAKVSKATLHNIEYIRALDLKIGCRVEVIRSGEIIPRILRRVDL